MRKSTQYSIRKCSDINLDDSYYEILDEYEDILFDISVYESGEKHILFYQDCINKRMSINQLKSILTEADELMKE